MITPNEHPVMPRCARVAFGFGLPSTTALNCRGWRVPLAAEGERPAVRSLAEESGPVVDEAADAVVVVADVAVDRRVEGH